MKVNTQRQGKRTVYFNSQSIRQKEEEERLRMEKKGNEEKERLANEMIRLRSQLVQAKKEKEVKEREEKEKELIAKELAFKDELERLSTIECDLLDSTPTTIVASENLVEEVCSGSTTTEMESLPIAILESELAQEIPELTTSTIISTPTTTISTSSPSSTSTSSSSYSGSFRWTTLIIMIVTFLVAVYNNQSAPQQSQYLGLPSGYEFEYLFKQQLQQEQKNEEIFSSGSPLLAIGSSAHWYSECNLSASLISLVYHREETSYDLSFIQPMESEQVKDLPFYLVFPLVGETHNSCDYSIVPRSSYESLDSIFNRYWLELLHCLLSVLDALWID
ncbi:DNA ligase I [Tieghemostelium lacteum]|uniref:DNA ligase I n=1 Tax=Tieghemostelium lacteum TaxID=361077 RepID=A0A151ZB25_TIELA|nr:DNA ligase I [Tieghemostelium lacteum]|eukprot:KYQ91152.1 DNA ligase I [Tieghemostelium lacteum]